MGIEDAQFTTNQEQGRLPERSFFERHQEDLIEAFDILSLPSEAGQSLEAAVNCTQPWVKGDHSRQQHKFHIPDGKSRRMYELYDELDLVREVPLPSGDYDEIVLPGAVQAGNRRRLGFVSPLLANGHVTTRRLTLLGGQRVPFKESEPPDIDATLQAIEERDVEGPWLAVLKENSLRDPQYQRLWETDGLRLAALEHFGAMALRRIDLRLDQPADVQRITETPDPLLGYEFMWRNIPVSLMHTLAVKRANGDPRHTTAACMADWLERRQPASSAKIGFIAANPHLERMVRDARKTLADLGRDDLLLVPAGSAAHENVKHGHFLGEVARNLYQDYLDTKSV